MAKKPTVSGLSVYGDCYYYRKTKAKDFGYYLRFPPVVIAIDEDGTILCESPIVGKERESCGEYTQGPRIVN